MKGMNAPEPHTRRRSRRIREERERGHFHTREGEGVMAADNNSGLSPVHSVGFRATQPTIAKRGDEKDGGERARARRALIYSDMLTKTGRIQYALLWQWMYQPSEAEVTAHVALLESLRDSGRLREKKRLAALAAEGVTA
jgi:hypothetical protein